MHRFEAHVNLVNEFKYNDASKSIPSDILLELYGLYKQATIGDVATDRPSMFYYIERSKWDAWDKQSGLTKESAMKLYIKTIKQTNKSYTQ